METSARFSSETPSNFAQGAIRSPEGGISTTLVGGQILVKLSRAFFAIVSLTTRARPRSVPRS